MKARINETNIVKTPNYMNLPTNSAGLSELGFPAILKSEFSCNSEGIAKVINLDDALNKIEAFRELYGQRIFLEAWERQNEYTVAYVPPSLNEAGEAAALKLLLSNQSDYYDLETKSSKINVSFIRPKKETAEVLEKVTLDLVEELSIDGHFRADYIQNEKNELFLIDLNFMPYLSIVEGSTFPKAFEQKGQWRFEKLIFRLIAHSIERIL